MKTFLRGFLTLTALLATFAPPARADERPRYHSDHFATAKKVECSFLIAWHSAGNIDYLDAVIDWEIAEPFIFGARDLYQWDERKVSAIILAMQTLTQHLRDAGQYMDFRLVNPELILQFVRSATGTQEDEDHFAHALRILKELPERAFQWGRPLLSQGPITQFESLLEHAGVDPGMSHEASVALSVAADFPYEDPLTRTVARTLRRKTDAPIACVVGGRCRIAPATQAAAYFLPVTNPEHPFRAVKEITGPASYPRVVPEVGLSRLTDFVVVPRPELSGVETTARWLSMMLHELTHWYDIRVLSAWVRANQRLINRGLPPDALFQTYVRIEEHEGKLVTVLDSRFRTVFYETRAYRVMANVFEAFAPKSMLRRELENERTRLSWQGYNYCILQECRSVLEAMGVRGGDKKFFELGDELGDIMEFTIRSAGVEIP